MQAQETEFWIASERNGEYPFTREDSFERKLRRHRKLQTQLHDLVDPQRRAIAYLERVEIQTVLEIGDGEPSDGFARIFVRYQPCTDTECGLPVERVYLMPLSLRPQG